MDTSLRATSFNRVVREYEDRRPGYPDSFVDFVLERCGLGEGSSVLEIGCGPGVATVSLLARGLDVQAVEPGPDLAARAAERFRNEPFRVDVSTFEEWDSRGRRFDAAVAATSFHWVDAAVRWTRAAEALRFGGHVILMANKVLAGSSYAEFVSRSESLMREAGMDDLGSALLEEPEFLAELREPTDDVAELWARVDSTQPVVDARHLFVAPRVIVQSWRQNYDAEEMVALLATYSRYITLDDESRRSLMDHLRAIIIRDFGGRLERRYLSVAVTATRRGV
ncbi:MAG: methyltransferase domain-containing protein [Acidobacteria bacterium]|nr:methyltransferase domain-containing protein [Acidobacteriota bacterium]